MGAGGLNGELRDNPSSYIDTILHHYQSNGSGPRGGTHQQQFSFHTSTHTNPSFPSSSSFPTTNHPTTNHPTSHSVSDEDMVCYSCSVNFTIWKRKKTCLICTRDFCKECFREGTLSPEPSVTNCLICRSLKAPHLHKELLQKIKIKDLCDFLQKKNISFQNCKEKRELIQLVLESSPSSSQTSSQTRTSSQPTQQEWTTTTSTNNGSTNSNASRSAESNGSTQGARNSGSSSQTTSADKAASGKNTAVMRTIEDVKTVNQIYSLSIKELKRILVTNCVDFKGCCEKNELLEKVSMLWKDRNKSKENNTGSDDEDGICKVCMVKVIDCVLLECGHMITCMDCSKKVTECPICRQHVIRIVKVFKA